MVPVGASLSPRSWYISSHRLPALAATAAALLCAAAAAAAQDLPLTGFDSVAVVPRMPKALSDLTAVVSNSTSTVYLHGGCDAADGNRYDTARGKFVCASVSNASYRFDLVTATFTPLADMPAARFRHAAVLVNNQVWVVGGRDSNDSIVTTVHVYEIANDTWTAYDDLDETHYVSDLAGFAGPFGSAYFVAGYNLTYAAQSSVFSIDPVNSTSTGRLVVTDRAPLSEARGDHGAVLAYDVGNNNAPYALVTGGFTDANGFCEPLGTVERFEFQTFAWSEATDLLLSRADMALVTVKDRIFVLAGERQLGNICTVAPEDKPEPGEETVPITGVEWYNETANNWTAIANFPLVLFRFAAIAYLDSFYSFGGQVAYNTTCKCFATTDYVGAFTESYKVLETFSPTSAPIKATSSATGRRQLHYSLMVSTTICMTVALVWMV